MKEPSWWEVLDACPVADDALWLKHARAFVAAFVTSVKKQRWLWLLTNRPRRVGRDSHKLHSDLDRRVCQPVGMLTTEFRRNGSGLYYAFADDPKVVPTDSIALAAGAGDAIYSLVPGELAVYFFHEGEVWLCESHK